MAAKTSPALEPGATFGRYRIVRQLGAGAMGAVYLAEDLQLDRKVALKTPHFEHDPSGELLVRFRREAQACAALRHANVCELYDVGEIEGKHYITMAYIEGQPLSSLVSSERPHPERKTLLLVHKLALALHEAHRRGVVHRDLKPANVMLDKRGEPIVMDFGLARQLDRGTDTRLTQSGMLIGSPAYMSPEQIEGDPEQIGPATDQFSLGVMLYELLTGQLPFRGSMAAIMGQIVTREPVPPGDLRPDLDVRIERVCLRMMAKSATDRFTDMQSIAQEIAAILKAPSARTAKSIEPIEVEPAPISMVAAPPPPPRRSKRRQAAVSTSKRSLLSRIAFLLGAVIGSVLLGAAIFQVRPRFDDATISSNVDVSKTPPIPAKVNGEPANLDPPQIGATRPHPSKEKALETDLPDIAPKPAVQQDLVRSGRGVTEWRYTTTRPRRRWLDPDFDDGNWARGKADFSSNYGDAPTKWNTPDIWLRTQFEWKPQRLEKLSLKIKHDDAVQVYLNGELVLERFGWIRPYQTFPLGKEHNSLLRPGRNVLAVHCHNRDGGQFIDVGLSADLLLESDSARGVN